MPQVSAPAGSSFMIKEGSVELRRFSTSLAVATNCSSLHEKDTALQEPPIEFTTWGTSADTPSEYRESLAFLTLRMLVRGPLFFGGLPYQAPMMD